MTDDPRITGEWNDDAAAWMERFAARFGIVAALDHLHLSGMANDVAHLFLVAPKDLRLPNRAAWERRQG